MNLFQTYLSLVFVFLSGFSFYAIQQKETDLEKLKGTPRARTIGIHSSKNEFYIRETDKNKGVQLHHVEVDTCTLLLHIGPTISMLTNQEIQ